MPKISVIMPCLNMRKYISECVESVIGQTLGDIEILVIDAGSTDGTLEILKEYQHKDNRIKLILSEKKSYGYQVNLGISMALGEYIAIVDADDRVKPDIYEILYPIAVSTGADFVKGTVQIFYTVGDRYIYQNSIMQFRQEEYNGGRIEATKKDMPEIFVRDPYLWYGIYRSDFFKKIKFHESSGAAYQDVGGLLQTFMNAEKAVYIKKPVYEYRQDNLNASEYNPRVFELIVKEYEWCEPLLKGKPKEWYRAFYRKFYLHTLSRFYIMVYIGKFCKGSENAIEQIVKQLSRALEQHIIGQKDFDSSQWEYLQMFLKDPKKLYEMLDQKYDPSRIVLCNLLPATKGKDVVIFGSGQLGEFLHLIFINNNMENVKAFCDNDPSVQNTLLHEIAILSPEEAVALYPNALYIVANKNNAEEMKRQLIRIGIEKSSIMHYGTGRGINLFKGRFI